MKDLTLVFIDEFGVQDYTVLFDQNHEFFSAIKNIDNCKKLAVKNGTLINYNTNKKICFCGNIFCFRDFSKLTLSPQPQNIDFLNCEKMMFAYGEFLGALNQSFELNVKRELYLEYREENVK